MNKIRMKFTFILRDSWISVHIAVAVHLIVVFSLQQSRATVQYILESHAAIMPKNSLTFSQNMFTVANLQYRKYHL